LLRGAEPLMNNIAKGFLTVAAGAGTFAGAYFSPAARAINDFFAAREMNPLGLSSSPQVAAGLIAAAVFAICGIIWMISELRKDRGRSTGVITTAAGIGTGGLNPLYERIHHAVRDYHKAHKKRQSTRDFSKRPMDPSVVSDHEALYSNRLDDGEFLNRLVDMMSREESRAPRQYQSGEHPELLVDEVRELLQYTLYAGVLQFENGIDYAKLEHYEIDWPTFYEVMRIVQSFARALKNCLDFYLDMCRHEKNKFNKFKEYGVLPLPVGNPDGPDLYNLINEKKLGDQFDHNSILQFKDHAAQVGAPFNPSIPGAFDFFDRCVADLVNPLELLMSRARPFFKVYHLVTRSEAYDRIIWIQDNLSRINSDSADYYAETLTNFQAQLKLEMKEVGILTMPDGAMTMADIRALKVRLEDKKEGVTRIVYQRDSMRKDD
jgi:hypothetical protein